MKMMITQPRAQLRPGSPCLWLAPLLLAAHVSAGDWPMLGRDKTRNAVSRETNAPIEWDLDTGRNIKWKAEVGSIAVAQPVVANGLVWIGTNNDTPRDPSMTEPAGVLACFRETDGKLLDQNLSAANNRQSQFGMTGSPMVEGDRLWFVNTAAEIVCLDISRLASGKGRPQLVWRLEMPDELGVYSTVDVMGGKGMCSPAAPYGSFIYIITGNGHDWTRSNIPFPSAPALVCLNKHTGHLVWEDSSSSTNILFGEFASPLVIEAGGAAQVITPQGDGWVRSFEAGTGKLLWKFDSNAKAPRRKDARNFFLNSPVFHEGRVYIANGRDVESGEGPGRLVCLDPGRRGDLSLELEEPPGQVKSNPNSGVLWHFDELGRTLSNVAVQDGLVVAVDFSGFVYCLDAATGGKLWKHDMGAHVWGSPLVVDGKIYIGNEDGKVCVLALGRDKALLFTTLFDGPVYASPIFANGVLYVVAQPTLYAIQTGARGSAAAATPTPQRN